MSFSNDTVVHTYHQSNNKSLQDLDYVATKSFKSVLSNLEMLNETFLDTNSIDIHPWIENESIMVSNNFKDGCRSTQVDDIMNVVDASGNSTWYKVSPSGFDLIDCP